MSTKDQPDKCGDTANCNQQTGPKSGVLPPATPIESPIKKDQNPNKRFFERWKYEIEFAGLLGLIFYCFVNWKELRVFDSERQTMEKEFLVGQTNSADQLKALQGQLDETKQARIQDERAWVYVTIPRDAWAVSTNDSTVNLIMKNVGKTPALITSEVGFLTENTNVIKLRDPIGKSDSLVVIPNSEAKLIIAIPVNVDLRILQNAKVYVFGTVNYSDISGNSHWTQFCFFFSQNGVLMQTESFHNSCDDLETQPK